MAKHSLTDIYVPVRWHLLLDWVCPYLGKRICSLQSHAWFLNRIMSYKLAKSIVYIEYISFLTKVVQSYHLFPINSYISYLHFSVSSSCFQYSQHIPFFFLPQFIPCSSWVRRYFHTDNKTLDLREGWPCDIYTLEPCESVGHKLSPKPWCCTSFEETQVQGRVFPCL